MAAAQANQKTTTFTLADAQKAWHIFGEKVKAEGNQMATIIMEESVLEVTGNVVKIILHNSVLKDALTRMKPPLLKHLRTQLHNDLLEVQEEFIAKEVEKKMLYTQGDKFQHLTEKFPILQELKSKLALDIEE
jgi:DNA polymerase III subunit gamma/tau